jgi:hypothetical protein
VRELNHVIKILADEVFNNEQQRYYLVIDKLDEDWVDDTVRYLLIKALVEAVKELNHAMKAVKIVIAIRRDLLDRVIQKTKEVGFQEEKYEPLFLNLKWTKEQLFEMLDRRVNKLVRRQYTHGTVSWSDLMPQKIGPGRQLTIDYLSDRTMYRPRDLIVLFNRCIEQAVGRPEITAAMIQHAESEYSQRRLTSLYDEWRAEFPELSECVDLLKRLPAHFHIDAIPIDKIEDKCLALATGEARDQGVISGWAKLVADQKMKPSEFRARLVGVLYQTGLLGLKIEATTSIQWSFLHVLTIPWASIRDDGAIVVCPVFHRALGINPIQKAS